MTAGLAVAQFGSDLDAGGVSLVRLGAEQEGPWSITGFDRPALEVGPSVGEDRPATPADPPAHSEPALPATDPGATFVFADPFGDPLAGADPFRALFPISTSFPDPIPDGRVVFMGRDRTSIT